MTTEQPDATRIPLTPAQVLENARGMLAALRERMNETEQLRRLPDSTVEEAAAAGLTGFLLPRSLGGSGASAREFFALARLLAHGDMSAAWTLSFYTMHASLLARFDEPAQKIVFADGVHPRIAFVGRPPGKAIPVEGGYLVSGAWRYGTGVMHAHYALVPAIVEDTEALSLFLVPRDQVEIVDTWRMTTMQGTGSNDIRISEGFVPAPLTIDWEIWRSRGNPGAALHHDPVLGSALNEIAMFLFPSLAVGAAETMVEEYRARLDRHPAAFSPLMVGDTTAGQLRYARALSSLRLAQARLDATVELSAEANAESPKELPDEMRAILKLDCLGVLDQVWETVELVVRGSGTSIFRTGDPTGAYLRAVQALLSHVTADQDGMTSRVGEILLGRATGPAPSAVFV